jgi:hypothetical protein
VKLAAADFLDPSLFFAPYRDSIKSIIPIGFTDCAKTIDLGNSPLNLEISIFGFARNNSSKRFGVSLEMKWHGAARFDPSP